MGRGIRERQRAHYMCHALSASTAIASSPRLLFRAFTSTASCRKLSPTIVFIDEIDCFLSARGADGGSEALAGMKVGRTTGGRGIGVECWIGIGVGCWITWRDRRDEKHISIWD